ncbi:MAG: BNR-4 repeat-containing protein [Pirellulales bacterium]|nr:BNR-4 repeat-containing protein [Pirellulales bacterium]
MRHFLLATGAAALVCVTTAARGQTPVTTIVNPSFEIGTPGTAVTTGWTQVAGLGPMFIANASSGGDVAFAHSGSNYLTANRQVPEPDYPTSQNMGVFQIVDLSPYAGLVNQGGQRMQVSFAYNDNDPNDTAVVAYSFLDGMGATLGNTYTFSSDNSGTGAWATTSLVGDIPVGTNSMRLTLQTAWNNFGTVRNVSFDSVSASILPPAAPLQPAGIVHGNLIQFDGSGAWTWYSDERAVVDPNNGRVLVNSVGFSPSYQAGVGIVDVVDFNPQTGRRVRTQLSNLSGISSQNIQVDDHNNGALLVLPDGRYLAMYANHGNNGGLGDRWSRWRVSTNPGDSTSWSTEQVFNWFTGVPGADQTGNANAANVSYHNLFYLSDEDQVYNISRSYGQLSTNGASQNMPNIMRYDMATNTVEWAGQLLESAAQGYSAYPKYASNGVNRIYFTTTETHPRNYNNSIYAGYIENGQTFDMAGNLIDADIFDNGTAAGGSGFVPDVTAFTTVQQADPLGAGYNRLWTVDMNLDAAGDPMALYVSRWNPDGSTSAGSTTNPIDHRLHFAHWNEQTGQWAAHEVARMGNRLYRGADLSEQDYTGNAALVPGDPSTIYVSTPYDPRDSSGATFTSSYEIYKGKTADGGANWSWTAVTENSVVDNLRPIVPDPHGGAPTVLWFRGTYTTAHSINAAIVGIVDRDDEQLGLVTYVDATTANTTRLNGTPVGATGPNGNAGANDNLWHVRTGVGNGGSVFASSESGFENAPMLKTTLSGLADGTYDMFAYFWSNASADWRLLAGLESDNLVDFRRYGSQHATADQFTSIETVSAEGNSMLLYRAYLGRRTVAGGENVDVFIDDWQSLSGSAIRTWYDGVGYALVTPTGIDGDFNGDSVVDGADFLAWQRNPAVGDLATWQTNFGASAPATWSSTASSTAVPEPAAAALLAWGATMATRLRRRRGE